MTKTPMEQARLSTRTCMQ